ncbi:ParA family protein [Streptomyces sp. SBT349]|uniref:ParA family protein n=1 Tax=Streptomyces sp. SBT349 TaxID=1580539 RepID=UPI00066EF344|nr:AAA family ATPase [Streptomyces sp. SBT349]
MTSIALFNNKGGVGKTTLVYHLAHMFQRLGLSVLAVDLDPQSNLTAMCLDETELEELWEDSSALIDHGTGRVRAGETVADAVRPILEGTGDIRNVSPTPLVPDLWLLPGSLELSRFEDKLSHEWFRTYAADPAAIRSTTAFHRIIRGAADAVRADIVLIDIGPNLGAINRASLLAADSVLMPLAADLFSLNGLRNLGPTLRSWRQDWQQLILPRSPDGIPAPKAAMRPLGYVIMQPEMRLDRPVKAYARWLERIPGVFDTAVVGMDAAPPRDRSFEIATMRNYRSLMPLAHDARKPMFDLKPADGALGSTQKYVQTCFREFRGLAEEIATRLATRGPEEQ